jgi:cellulose synthase/poly-beta-1,6-N-acetylglucosamine synthase-like glycosyltransferase
MVRFSIIIPAYNRASLIGQTLDSVIGAADTQIIVVDDGSTDATREVVAGYGDRVTLLRQSQRGPGAARNLGLTIADGDYVAFLDSDDVWFPWTADTYRRVIKENAGAKFVAGKPFIFDAGPPAPPSPGPVSVETFPDYYASGEQWRWYSASSFVMHRQSLVAAGGFTDDWVNAEDADAAMRMGVAGRFVQITSPATFGYRRHAESAMSDLTKTYAGVRRLIDRENAGAFPGGPQRLRERRRIIATYVRPLSLSLIATDRRLAWDLYRRSAGWHLGLGRFKYLAGFPARWLLHR